MSLVAIEDYYLSSTHKPFFAVVGDDYIELIKKLTEYGTDFIRLSDCCLGQDKKPDFDLLREKLRTADVDCKSNRVVVLGLGEYLMLLGNDAAQNVLESLKDFNLGSAWAVILLRGDGRIMKKMAQTDPRFDNRRYAISESSCALEFDLSCSPLNIGMFDLTGIKALIKTFEDGASGSVGYNSDLDFPEANCTIKLIKNSYEAIKKHSIGFDVPRSIGDDEEWDFLLTQITEQGTLMSVFTKHKFASSPGADLYSILYGVSNTSWLYYLYLRSTSSTISDGYLKYVVENSDGIADFKYKILNAIIDIPHTDSRFSRFYIERKILVKNYPESEIAQFVVNNRIDLKESIYRLTDNIRIERQEIIALIAENGVPDSLKDIYPDLFMYLSKYHFQGDALSAELTEYFEEYKQQKIHNRIEKPFMEKVENYALSRAYNRLRTRDELIASLPKESTFLCWIDALGSEYLAYIVEGAKKRGLHISVKVGRAKLPTITSVNNQFFYEWPEAQREKIEELDDIKHKDKGGYKYGPNNKYPIHLAAELAVLEEALNRAATELALRHYDRYVLASDHGASRLAVISNIEEKYDTDTKGEHSGRCCRTFEKYDLPFATEENGFVVLADYGRFRGSRAANVEVHGGASLEEVVVPLIELTLADNTIQIQLANENVISDFKLGSELLLFVNKALSKKLSIQVEGESYEARKVDENHYKVTASNMKRAKTYSVDVYIDDSLITRFSVTTKGKSASVNSDFDDLF